MKTLLTLVSAFLMATTAIAADQVVELNSKTVTLGALSQDRGAAAQATINVVRTTETPDLVELVFNFKEGEYVCTEWRDRVVYEPGYYRVVCNTDRYGRQYCRRIYTGGYYRTYSECVRREYRLFNEARVLKLNFKKAESLRAGERETFSLNFAQRGLDSGKFDYTARTVDTVGDYEIKYSTFLRKDTFFFKAK